jgi:prefoldin subunit 5
MQVDISSYDLDEEKNIMTMKVNISNKALETGFFMREIGIFVEDPENADNEILYSVMNAGYEGDFLPRFGNIPVEIILEIFAVVGEAEHIEVVINDTLIYVLRNEYETKIEEMNTKISQVEKASMNAIEEVKIAVGDDPNFAESISEEIKTISETMNSVTKDQSNIEQSLGNLEELKTTDKTNVTSAINELFQNVSNGKQTVGTAITDIDPNTVVPTNPTFAELSVAIKSISTGAKMAKGTKTLNPYGEIIVTGLDFTPAFIFVRVSVNRTDQIMIYSNFKYSGTSLSIKLNNARVLEIPNNIYYGAFILSPNETDFGNSNAYWLAIE